MKEDFGKLNKNEQHGPWYYPEDRKPTDEEYAQKLTTDEDFLKVGPKFSAHYWAHQDKEVLGAVDLSVIRSRLLQVFCQENINDESMKHFDDIAVDAYMEHR